MDAEVRKLTEFCERQGYSTPEIQDLPGGGKLVRINKVILPKGKWNRDDADVLFVVPPGYPAARPDCFWVTPASFRLAGGGTPQASNDGNPIPGDPVSGRPTTWFSWHLSHWTPGQDSLVSYFQTILTRLTPAR